MIDSWEQVMLLLGGQAAAKNRPCPSPTGPLRTNVTPCFSNLNLIGPSFVPYVFPNTFLLTAGEKKGLGHADQHGTRARA